MMREDKNSKMTNKNFTGAVVWRNWGAVRDAVMWLIHSVPRFPPVPKGGQKYRYPDSGIVNGQSFLCIRANFNHLAVIANDLFYTWPWIYAHNNPDVSRFPILWKVLYGGPTENHQNKNTVHQDAVQTISQFTVFSKTGGFNRDIYRYVIVPELQEATDNGRLTMYVETWIRPTEENPKLPSFCKGWTRIYNVESIRNLVGYQYSETQDHSKWAVTNTGYVCVGGSNRQESQTRRGGNAVCLHVKSLADQMIKGIGQYEECPRGEEIEAVGGEWQKSSANTIGSAHKFEFRIVLICAVCFRIFNS